MKIIAIIILFIALAGCAGTRFSVEDLSSHTAMAYRTFRSMKWEDRSEIGMTLLRLEPLASLANSGAEPPSSKRVTISQIVQLLGQPDYRAPNELEYILWKRGAMEGRLIVKTRHNLAIKATAGIVEY